LKQIQEGIFQKNYTLYSQIPNIGKKLKDEIISVLGDEILTIKKLNEVQGDNAHKVLFHTKDNHHLEAVRLQYKNHAALCISSQAGCALACTFCATGAIGLKKNLTSDEIIDQVLWFQKQGLPIDRIIFMGMGEPFSNPLNVFESLEMMVGKDCLHLSPRRISVSTVGIVPGMTKLTKEFPNVNLAFSLHSPFSDQRLSLMPITRAYPIEKVFIAIDNHLKVTNHKVFISYVLMKDVNDSIEHATALAELIRQTPDRLRLCHINLIRYNPGPSLTVYQRPDRDKIDRFMEVLENNRLHHTLRQDFGLKIAAACGQLAASAKP
jgi:23S rRNA (adenine-C8)-methyltransferase